MDVRVSIFMSLTSAPLPPVLSADPFHTCTQGYMSGIETDMPEVAKSGSIFSTEPPGNSRG